MISDIDQFAQFLPWLEVWEPLRRHAEASQRADRGDDQPVRRSECQLHMVEYSVAV